MDVIPTQIRVINTQIRVNYNMWSKKALVLKDFVI